jgi:hypothetical protein
MAKLIGIGRNPRQYHHGIFYMPNSANYAIIYNTFKQLCVEDLDPTTFNANPMFRSGTVIRRLVMKYTKHKLMAKQTKTQSDLDVIKLIDQALTNEINRSLDLYQNRRL